MIDGVISGKLLLDPKTMYSSRGSKYLIAKMRAYGYKQGARKAPPMYADIIAFTPAVRDALRELHKGDEVSIAGVITVAVEAGDDGRPEVVLKVTATAVLQGYIYGQAIGRGRLFSLIA